MTDDDPEFADVFSAMPSVTAFGDAHKTPRPVGVVAPKKLVILTITRTTQPPPRNIVNIKSPADPSCGLTKPGWWTERFQRPIMREHFGTNACRYSGRLAEEQAQEFQRFWTQLCGLGLALGGG